MDNWRALVAGTAIVVGLYAIGLGTLWLVARQFYPRGQPVQIAELSFVDNAVAGGSRATMRVISDKKRQCGATPQIVYIDDAGAESPFLFAEWPWLAIGPSTVYTKTSVPPLPPGRYKYQARIFYDCPDESFIVTSPIDEVEIRMATR